MQTERERERILRIISETVAEVPDDLGPVQLGIRAFAAELKIRIEHENA